MLSIRMQRTGRKGHAMFRVIVQESRYVPTSGKVVAQLGSYNPHNKTLILDKEKASLYLSNGAQPSDRAARLLATEGIAMPSWVTAPAKHTRSVRNADKRRSTTPPAPVVAEEPDMEESAKEEPAAEAEESSEAKA